MRRLLVLLYSLQLCLLVLPIGHFHILNIENGNPISNTLFGFQSPITYVLLLLYLCCILALTWKQLHFEIAQRNKAPENLALTINFFPFVMGLVFAIGLWSENTVVQSKSTPGIGIILSVLLSLTTIILLIRYRFR